MTVSPKTGSSWKVILVVNVLLQWAILKGVKVRHLPFQTRSGEERRHNCVCSGPAGTEIYKTATSTIEKAASAPCLIPPNINPHEVTAVISPKLESIPIWTKCPLFNCRHWRWLSKYIFVEQNPQRHLSRPPPPAHMVHWQLHVFFWQFPNLVQSHTLCSSCALFCGGDAKFCVILTLT
jgi:hypothetical protein